MNILHKKLGFFLLAPALLISCSSSKKKENKFDLKARMVAADKAFSKMSETKGMKTAFMEYIDSNAVLLRPNTVPLVGANAIDYIIQGNDSSYSMTWEPKGASIAESGDMGYTYGVYAVRPKATDTVLYGTYVSIWKRQPDGKWKFVLDTGNEGIE